ncbi:DNA polymerase zeta [Yamadazyma tenuis]|uniref:DNA polymerase zeta n=1 Tax=Candida tenuis TaxID=2315449 RepID=UPI00279F8FE0|nr:DNA polymerase zeta [Yamadazyma tenuis]
MKHDSIRIQVNNYDSYQSLPSCLDSLELQVAQVPVIRVYGALVFIHNSVKYGYNALLHIHNVYPYVYVSCDYEFVKSLPEITHLGHVTSYLEAFMAASAWQKKKQPEEEDEQQSNELDITQLKSGKRRFIAKVSLCKGVPIYGYRVGYRLFYKINFLSPLYKARFTNLFNGKQVDMKQFSKSKFKFEIYESHIPYLSQFLSDYNLFSCNWLNFKNCYYRYPVISVNSYMDSKQLSILKQYLSKRIRNNVLHTRFERVGKSVLELDIKSSHILNRDSLVEQQYNMDFSQFNREPKNIGLSSVDLLIKEIKFQADICGVSFDFNSDIMGTNVDDSTTIWPNDVQLRELLDYSITLTGKIKNKNFKDYDNAYFRSFNHILEKYPTAFKLVDVEKSYMNSNVLVNDLYMYNDINELFIAQDSSFHEDISFVGSTLKDSYFDNYAKNDNEDPSSEVERDIEAEDDGPVWPSDSDFTLSDIAESAINDSQMFLELTQQQGHTQTPLTNEGQEPTLSTRDVLREFGELGVVKINYDTPYYDDYRDTPEKPLVFSNKKIKVPVKELNTLPNLSLDSTEFSSLVKQQVGHSSMKLQSWEYYSQPPSKRAIIQSYEHEALESNKRSKFVSQLEAGGSKSNDFKFSSNDTIDKRPDDFVELTNFLMEVHVNTSSTKLPNPQTDEISVIFYKFIDSNAMVPSPILKSGILINKKSFPDISKLNLVGLRRILGDIQFLIFDNESSAVSKLLEVVEYFDPDILSGFEINSMSWGYLVERFQKKLNISLLSQLSRSKINNTGKFGDRWGYTHTSNIRIVGRYTLNVWRVLRKDLALNNYTFENCCYNIYHQTLPKIENQRLSSFLKGEFKEQLFGFSYYVNKLNIVEYFISSLDIIDKNVELSRLVGIDFNSNFYRGSQFKVESILSRLAKAENFLLNSPSKEHVHQMKPLEQIPLIMEPNSGFYKSPLLVLDFQSLYPSIVIAYNLCYSTFLCRLHGFKPSKNPIGYLNHMNLSPMIIDLLHKNDCLTVTSNGLVFVKSKIRKSILAKMLQEILTLRINIKSFLQLINQDENPQMVKVFNSRQTALKLIANVTYGYASASFSGRMPNSDVADAIVATGREILTASIDIIEKSEFGCKVVYGDTDSLFVYLPGKSRDDAFEIGETLAKTVSAAFPNPVKLKFEKVYHPSILLSKKRYVGYSYELKDQLKPKFDAKGIETIRRDGIPAQQKIVERALKILFDTSNLSSVKKYVSEEFRKILSNKVIIKDFCFSKEVRYGTYKNEAYLPPGAIVARRNIENDERSEPQYRERIPYIVYRDPTKQRLKDRCVSPEEFIERLNTSEPMQLDYEYYILKVLIPPLERVFNLMGVDLQQWYKELSKPDNDIQSTSSGITNSTNYREKF